MTEAGWYECEASETLLESLRRQFNVARSPRGRRRLHLFTVACCRRFSDLITNARSQHFVDTLERYADGGAGRRELEAAEAQAFEVTDGLAVAYGYVRFDGGGVQAVGIPVSPSGGIVPNVWERATTAARIAVILPHLAAGRTARDFRTEWAVQSVLLRDIFGNPFRSSPPFPQPVLAWNDSTIKRIAQGIYDERAFDRLPILADALLDAGCDDEELIRHCRSDGPHVRGCWAVDLILGKS